MPAPWKWPVALVLVRSAGPPVPRNGTGVSGASRRFWLLQTDPKPPSCWSPRWLLPRRSRRLPPLWPRLAPCDLTRCHFLSCCWQENPRLSPPMRLNDPVVPTVLNWLSNWQWREGFVALKCVGKCMWALGAILWRKRKKCLLHLPDVRLSMLEIGCLLTIA